MAKKEDTQSANQWTALARNDWGDILTLMEKKAYQRKFQIIEAFTQLVSEKSLSKVTHLEIAKRCRITRQLVDHHFPTQESLIALAFRYTYARFQKEASDALLARVGFIAQIKAYIDAVAEWVVTYQKDARFLVQFYSLLQVSPELMALHERNIEIGRERISALCVHAKSEGFFPTATPQDLYLWAGSVQQILIGYLTLKSPHSTQKPMTEERAELWRSVAAILGLSLKKT